MLLSEKEARRVCEKFLGFTRADDAQVSLGAEDYSHQRFAGNTFTTNGRRQQVSASITVWINKKRASANASDLDELSLKSAVAKAEHLAELAPVDKEYV